MTPLNYAAFNGDLEIVKYLISKNAFIESKTIVSQIYNIINI